MITIMSVKPHVFSDNLAHTKQSVYWFRECADGNVTDIQSHNLSLHYFQYFYVLHLNSLKFTQFATFIATQNVKLDRSNHISRVIQLMDIAAD